MPERLVKYSLKRQADKKKFLILKKNKKKVRKHVAKATFPLGKMCIDAVNIVVHCPAVINYVVPPEVHTVYYIFTLVIKDLGVESHS